jgi:diaminopimelate decarboxylase
VLRRCVERGVGLEAASWEEVALAVAAGCEPSRIDYDSPAKTFTEIARALELGAHGNADSLDELDRIIDLRRDYPDSTATVALRVNPVVGGGSIPTQPGDARRARLPRRGRAVRSSRCSGPARAPGTWCGSGRAPRRIARLDD